AALGESIDERLELVAILEVDFRTAVRKLDSNTQVLERAGWTCREFDLPADAIDVVRPGHRVEGEIQVLGAARQRTDRGNVAIGNNARQCVSLRRDGAPGGL